jgi:5-methylcytosine-specific restriction protein A
VSKAPKHRGTTTTRTMPMGRAPRGPKGERLCRWCHGPTAPPRRTFCSEECVHEWLIRRDPGYVRQEVFKRDKGVCAVCGLDTVVALTTVLRLRDEAQKQVLWSGEWATARTWHEEVVRLHNRLLESHGLRPDPPWNRTASLWDADHIVPVVEGGGTCGLDGYRTLCVWCHRQETAKLATRRARERRPQQELPLGEEGST